MYSHLYRVARAKDGVCSSGKFDELDESTYIKTVKAAETAFSVVSYDERQDCTIILCRPVTGRTHQIRVHLQKLNHSIANDPNYGGLMWYGNPDGQHACQKAQAVLDAAREPEDGEEDNTNRGLVTTDVPATKDEAELQAREARSPDEQLEQFVKRTCVWCARNTTGRVDRASLEFLVRR
jgi:hypothetical protein